MAKKRGRGLMDEFDLRNRKGIDAPQRVKARNAYLRLKRQYDSIRAKFGPSGQSFEKGLGGKISRSRKGLKRLLGSSKRHRKSAGEW